MVDTKTHFATRKNVMFQDFFLSFLVISLQLKGTLIKQLKLFAFSDLEKFKDLITQTSISSEGTLRKCKQQPITQFFGG